MTTFSLALAALAAVGLVLTSLPVALLFRLKQRHRPFGASRDAGPRSASRQDASPTDPPRVSILKPLCGVDDGLEENLVSFTSLEGVAYEVILSVASPRDPALDVVARVRRDHPEAPFRLVVGGTLEGRFTNRKVERLVAAARLATGDVFLVSDSNVRVSPRDVADTVALLADPAAGCVSNVFVGEGARDLGARVESLHLLSFVVPGNVLAAWAGIPCVVGKSMALRRDVHDAIGGFATFSGVLAEDQAIGLAVAEAGYRVLLSPVVVRNVVEQRTVARALDRQVRWGMIRHAFSKATYAGEILLNPVALATAAAAAGAIAAVPAAVDLAGFAAATLLARLLQASVLARLTGQPLPPGTLAAMPLKDVLQVWSWLVPFFAREVSWHGNRARVGPGTRLLPAQDAATA